ncbi:hypothetical protein K438DRAFT_1753821 [Mycena galopus ATCC 62051]|nr:hypothetical protein K438DRAFT_1753821 [Mycena galopus ATCC 62051]
MGIAADIIRTTSQVASSSEGWGWNFNPREMQDMLYEFCSNLVHMDGWVTVALLTTGLLIHNWDFRFIRSSKGPIAASWVYMALKSNAISVEWDSETMVGVGGLLMALHDYNASPDKHNIHLIIKALSCGDTAGYNSQDYLLLGQTLSEIPDWHLYLHSELCSWITAFLNSQWHLAKTYNHVLINVCKVSSGGYSFTTPFEEALGLTYIALSHFWETLDFSKISSIRKLTLWLQCSSQAVLRQGYYFPNRGVLTEYAATTTRFRETFSVPIYNAFIKAAAAARHEVSLNGCGDDVDSSWADRSAELLEDLANKMPQVTDAEKDLRHWNELQKDFDAELNQLKSSG